MIKLFFVRSLLPFVFSLLLGNSLSIFSFQGFSFFLLPDVILLYKNEEILHILYVNNISYFQLGTRARYLHL